MDRITKTIFVAIGFMTLVFIVLSTTIECVPVRTYGVKQTIWAGGIEQEDYATGYHIGITGIHRWALLDASTHFLNFSAIETKPGSSKRGSGSPLIFSRSSGGPSDFETPASDQHPALDVRNRDGNVVSIDVSVPYRIIAGKAHLIVKDGAKDNYRERVKATVESVLRGVLSEMTNDELQDTAKRIANCEKALAALNTELSPFHVKADAVLIRKVAFPEEYEKKLQQKQLFTQTANFDVAETARLGEVLNTGKYEKEIAAAEALSLAQWEKKIESFRTEYTLQVARIQAEALQHSKQTRAEADAIHQTKMAEGKLALDKAEAMLTEKRSEALATPGGQIYVAKLAAENLNIGRVLLNASDPRVPLILDIHGIAEMLIGTVPATPKNP